MRRHGLFSRYAPFIEPTRFARVASAPYLAAARLQPSYYNWAEAWVDLVFRRDGETALVPFVQIEPAMLMIRETSPLLWPAWLPLEKPAIEGLEALLEPWLLSHGMVGTLDREVVRFFTDDRETRQLFEAAREARLLCAASTNDALFDAAPYVYAQRFANGRRLGIRSADGALGASMLARTASSVHADLGSAERNSLAQAWFGIGLYGEVPNASFDVTIGPADLGGTTASIWLEPGGNPDREAVLAQPLFSSVACSFDRADADVARRFWVRAREPIVRASAMKSAPIIGGSQGRIGIVVRDDGLVVPEADVDEAQALAQALRDQGFVARIMVASAARAEDVDLLHLFGHRHVAQFSYVLEDAARRKVPVVVTPFFDDFGNEALWGTTAIRSMLAGVRDCATIETIERALKERRVAVPPESERGKASYDPGLVRAMFRQAGAAIFAGPAEEAEVRKRFDFQGPARLARSLPSSQAPAEPIGALCSVDEYVLVHATVEPRSNQWNAVRAAAAIGVPCVLCGTVENVDYYSAVLGIAGPSTIWIPEGELSAGEMEALYGGARLFADLSWAGHGPARVVRAASRGAMPVISTALPFAELWPELAGGVDPTSLESAVTVMRQAWMGARTVGSSIAGRTAVLSDPLESLRAVLGAYAEAAGVRT